MTRTEIAVVEHGEAELPSDVVRKDGALDIYSDVQTKFEIFHSRKRKRFMVRSGGWLGYVPLNDKYALRISSRVPVYNLERIICRSSNVSVNVLKNYSVRYNQVADRPTFVFDILVDQFLIALDIIWSEGISKTYLLRELSSSTPMGRLDPFATAIRINTRGQLKADFSAFFRTVDTTENRVLKRALLLLLVVYRVRGDDTFDAIRLGRLQSAISRLNGVRFDESFDVSRSLVDEMASRLPEHRSSYVDALKLARFIISESGVSLTEGGVGQVKLPGILVDMANIFETYVREILSRWAKNYNGFLILDGNVSGREGGRRNLFDAFHLAGKTPPATPDIVVSKEGEIAAVIDVKYKPAKSLPDRADINQVVCYAVTYKCDKAMIVYPSLPQGERDSLQKVGEIGAIQIYRGSFDLNEVNIDFQEEEFARSIFNELG